MSKVKERVLILGAGIGGATIASNIDLDLYDVTLFEMQDEVSDLGHNWEDFINTGLLATLHRKYPQLELNEFLPEEFKNVHWKMIGPDNKSGIDFHIDTDSMTMVNRKKLATHLFNLAQKNGIEIQMGKKTKLLSNSQGRIIGVRVWEKTVTGEWGNPKDVYADLVIDSRGVKPNASASTELFMAHRDVIEVDASGFAADNTVFVKPEGSSGIGWGDRTAANKTDILVGVTEGDVRDITPDFYQTVEEYHGLELPEPNQNKIYKIPVRYPSTRMYYPGWVGLGDRVNMTVPLNGSGVAHTMRAAMGLVNILNNRQPGQELSTMDFHQYQYEYLTGKNTEFGAIGANCVAIDVFKRWLLSTKPENVNYLFAAGIITDSDSQKVMTGHFIDEDLEAMLYKLKKIAAKPNAIVAQQLLQSFMKAKYARGIASTLPENYGPMVRKQLHHLDKVMTGKPRTLTLIKK